jgi:hypothetical protein
MLANSTASIFETLQNDENFSDMVSDGMAVSGYEIGDGSVINWYSREPRPPKSGKASKDLSLVDSGSELPRIQSEYVVELTAGEANINNTTKDALTAKLPGKATGVTFSSIEANVYNAYYSESSSVNERGISSVDEDINKDKIADFVKLGKAVTISLDVSDAEPVKSGMTRKWYVTREVNGNVETVSDITYNEKAKTITFKTDTFGNFAYGYVDTKAAPSVPNTGSAPEKVAMVATATFAPLAAIVLGAFIARSRKKAANKLAKKHNHFE